VKALVSHRSWGHLEMDFEFPDDPIDEIIGTWSRRQVISMDTRFCEAVERALAAERAEPEAEQYVCPLASRQPAG
jgi:hypothetical protein